MALKNCVICSKEFYVKPSQDKLGWGKYCSVACQRKGQRTGQKVACYICEKEIYRPKHELERSKSGLSFCSKSCQAIWRNRVYSGENHPHWKDGSNQDYRSMLLNSKNERKCILCGVIDLRILVVHHLDENRTNNNLINLCWVCHNCHHLIHCHNVNL
ncbi:MAG: hypothetical protein WCW17_03715 [Patescibacteria group bacterium]|jgi:hypothetical protein